jgi:hypothetical protein
MRVIRISENKKDVYLSITKEDITVMLTSITFWLGSMPQEGLISAKLIRLIRMIEKDPGYFTETEDVAYDVETAEFLMFLNNGCNTIRIVTE